jgi:ASC-1-like (ASCH) protein
MIREDPVIYVLPNIEPDNLSLMRCLEKGKEKSVDIRVPDPDDEFFDYSKIKKGDIIHFVDTNDEVLRVGVNAVRKYERVEQLLVMETLKKVWPDLKFQQAVEKCLSFGDYKDNINEFGIYALSFSKLPSYVAGPYTDYENRSDEVIIANKDKAVECGSQVALLGYPSFVPHSAYLFWEKLDGFNPKLCEGLELHMLELCYSFYLMESSPGADYELEVAKEGEKPIFTSMDDLRYWRPSSVHEEKVIGKSKR